MKRTIVVVLAIVAVLVVAGWMIKGAGSARDYGRPYLAESNAAIVDSNILISIKINRKPWPAIWQSPRSYRVVTVTDNTSTLITESVTVIGESDVELFCVGIMLENNILPPKCQNALGETVDLKTLLAVHQDFETARIAGSEHKRLLAGAFFEHPELFLPSRPSVIR